MITQSLLANPRPDLGIMYQPGMKNDVSQVFQFWPWAADNGCFSQGDTFDAGNWLEWLASLRRHRDHCRFAVAPDVMADAAATWERSAPYLPTIRQLGYPAALVAQDGIERTRIDWDAFDCLFVGGTDEFKLGEIAYSVAAEAKRRGKWVHLGRCNSFQRLSMANANYYDSADGTFLKYGPDVNLGKVYRWLDKVNGQAALIALEGAA